MRACGYAQSAPVVQASWTGSRLLLATSGDFTEATDPRQRQTRQEMLSGRGEPSGKDESAQVRRRSNGGQSRLPPMCDVGSAFLVGVTVVLVWCGSHRYRS